MRGSKFSDLCLSSWTATAGDGCGVCDRWKLCMSSHDGLETLAHNITHESVSRSALVPSPWSALVSLVEARTPTLQINLFVTSIKEACLSNMVLFPFLIITMEIPKPRFNQASRIQEMFPNIMWSREQCSLLHYRSYI